MSLLTTFLLSGLANAWIFVGNPMVHVSIDVPGTSLTYGGATADYLRMHKCAGGYDQYTIDKQVDLVSGFDVAIAAGDYCGTSVKWSTDVEFGAASFDAVYSEPHTSVTLTGSTSEAGLTPFELTAGTMPQAGPRLVVTID
jgi:hypothetical protein